MSRPPKAISDYMAALGKKGGEAKGARKKRSAAHYKRMVEARKAKRSRDNQTGKP